MTPEDLARATPAQPVRVGRYDVVGLIRAGGMGTVHDAIDRDTGTRVALKTLNHLGAASLLRFKTEFRSVADLSHPNLVSLYELSCHEGLWFFTMERIDGVDFIAALRGGAPSDMGTVEARGQPSASTQVASTDDSAPLKQTRAVAASPPQSIPAVRDALHQLVRGVGALHSAGLLHLDLKPSNVLIDRNGRVVVLDFGLVRTMDAARAVAADSNSISGTPSWMAPEQYAGEGIGAPADWYAVGLMLYLALTGVPAFKPASVAMLSYAKNNVPPPPPDALLGELPRDLCALAMGLLSPLPEHRPHGDALRALASQPSATVPRADRLAARSLVGRAQERNVLRDTLDRVRAGASAVVHVVGPSGVGKSALLGALRDDALADVRDGVRARVLRGRCYERETVPYKAFDGMLDELAAQLVDHADEAAAVAWPPWLDALCRVFPVLATVPTIAAQIGDRGPASESVSILELRRRAVEALAGLFAALASARPLVLLIEDLHWADQDSAELLAALLEPHMPKALLLAASFRPAEAAENPAVEPYFEATRRLGERGHLVTVDVGPLPAAEAEQLAAATLDAVGVRSPTLAAAIAGEAGGVPYYVEELAHYAAQTRAPDAPEASDAHIGAGDVGHGVSLDRVLALRVAALPSAERALVDVLAVAGRPVPRAVAIEVAGIDRGVMRALWSLRAGQFVRGSGAGSGGEERLELHHDGMRAAVLRVLPPARLEDIQLSLGRVFASRALRAAERGSAPWLFEAVRHLNATSARLVGDERRWLAELNLDAGRRARSAAAFPLAFACFHAGAELLAPGVWTSARGEDYDLALALHGGAAEAAYLSAEWSSVNAHVAEVKAHGRSVFDQLIAWEVQIDAAIARREYAAAVDAGLEVLRALDVDLPRAPSEADVGAELQRATAALARIGPAGLAALPAVTDPTVTTAMRILARISSAAYFAQPLLLAAIACRLVTTSAERGLSPATPYALSIYGIVLNTMGLLPEAHAWGVLALDLLARFPDRSLEARTRHVVHDLVGTWTVPLSSTLDDLRGVFAIGRETGDLEYASYAAHAYVHNAFYAGRELTGLLNEARVFGDFMRGYGQVNALHVHVPFEQILRCFTGQISDPARLDGDGFDEQSSLADARAAGSRSALCLVHMLMGVVRYHFGALEDASACFESARSYLDGVGSTWHVPMFHQYAALTIHALPVADRSKLRASADASLAALRALAVHGAENFAHRVLLVEAESARAEGDPALAIEHATRAAARASTSAMPFRGDVGLAHEIAARASVDRGDAVAAARHWAAARDEYAAWGASAKVALLDRRTRA